MERVEELTAAVSLLLDMQERMDRDMGTLAQCVQEMQARLALLEDDGK